MEPINTKENQDVVVIICIEGAVVKLNAINIETQSVVTEDLLININTTDVVFKDSTSFMTSLFFYQRDPYGAAQVTEVYYVELNENGLQTLVNQVDISEDGLSLRSIGKMGSLTMAIFGDDSDKLYLREMTYRKSTNSVRFNYKKALFDPTTFTQFTGSAGTIITYGSNQKFSICSIKIVFFVGAQVECEDSPKSFGFEGGDLPGKVWMNGNRNFLFGQLQTSLNPFVMPILDMIDKASVWVGDGADIVISRSNLGFYQSFSQSTRTLALFETIQSMVILNTENFVANVILKGQDVTSEGQLTLGILVLPSVYDKITLAKVRSLEMLLNIDETERPPLPNMTGNIKSIKVTSSQPDIIDFREIENDGISNLAQFLDGRSTRFYDNSIFYLENGFVYALLNVGCELESGL